MVHHFAQFIGLVLVGGWLEVVQTAEGWVLLLDELVGRRGSGRGGGRGGRGTRRRG
jgi:hypothetical protein